MKLANFFTTFCCSLVTLLSGCSHQTTSPLPTLSQPSSPIVIAHRGASGYLPEHTLSSALLAYQMGADYIEQDLVLSRDGELVVLHDIHIDRVTNVADKFPNRKRADGRYYAIDFDLVELKQLNVVERRDASGHHVFPNRYRGNAGFQIATFEEQIQLIQALNKVSDRQVGFYPEIKAPAWHREQGQDISKKTITLLNQFHLNTRSANVIIQCFDFDELKRLKTELGAKTKLVQLLGENSWQESSSDYDYLKTAAGIAEIAQYADGIGPWINQLINVKNLKPTGLHRLAQQKGLMIHPYTYRIDSLPEGISQQGMLDVLFQQLKVDGVFSDFTDVVKHYLDENSANTNTDTANTYTTNNDAI